MTETEAKRRAALIRLLWCSVFDDAECTCSPGDSCPECIATEALGLGPWRSAEWADWIGVARRDDGARGVFDINCLQNGSGWVALHEWARVVAPELARGHDRRASGGWHITHAIQVERASQRPVSTRSDGVSR